LSVPDEGYSRNASCALMLTSTFLSYQIAENNDKNRNNHNPYFLNELTSYYCIPLVGFNSHAFLIERRHLSKRLWPVMYF